MYNYITYKSVWLFLDEEGSSVSKVVVMLFSKLINSNNLFVKRISIFFKLLNLTTGLINSIVFRIVSVYVSNCLQISIGSEFPCIFIITFLSWSILSLYYFLLYF